ncbi:MAG: glycerate kinase [Eubacteriales bacterium]
MKIVVISDSFKGSLSSSDIIAIAQSTIPKYFPDCEIVGLPVADGGEGTVDCFLKALDGKKVETMVTGPLGEQVCAYFGLFGTTAVIEMAQTAGLPLVGEQKDPSLTTTYGVGEQIAFAIRAGATNIVLGLGGSATHDGGCGAAAALGVKFLDQDGVSFIPTGATLDRVVSVDSSQVKKTLKGVDIQVICDIDNPACGENGAAAIFAPQKGADSQMVQELDEKLFHLVSLFPNREELLSLEGGGAAGGFGVGAVVFLGAKLRAGIEVVLDHLDFTTHLQDCDLVITGEGCMDGQSMRGKVPIGVAHRAKDAGVPVVAIVGVLGAGSENVYDHGICAIFPTNRLALPFEKVIPRAKEDYRATLGDVMTILKL